MGRDGGSHTGIRLKPVSINIRTGLWEEARYHTGNFARLNRADGPEDGGLADRCLHSRLPEFGSLFGGSFRRIVQTPGDVSMFYDVNQGQRCQSIRQWFGDMASAVLLERHSLERTVRWRIVANELSMTLVVHPRPALLTRPQSANQRQRGHCVIRDPGSAAVAGALDRAASTKAAELAATSTDPGGKARGVRSVKFALTSFTRASRRLRALKQ
jgi:hypothetical protein